MRKMYNVIKMGGGEECQQVRCDRLETAKCDTMVIVNETKNQSIENVRAVRCDQERGVEKSQKVRCDQMMNSKRIEVKG